MHDFPLDPDLDIEVTETPEGTEVRFFDHPCSLKDAYLIMSDMSRKNDGQPVTFCSLLPGIDLHVQSRWQQDDGAGRLHMEWQSARHLLNRLIESDPPESVLTMESTVAISTVSRTGNLQLPGTAIQLCWL